MRLTATLCSPSGCVAAASTRILQDLPIVLGPYSSLGHPQRFRPLQWRVWRENLECAWASHAPGWGTLSDVQITKLILCMSEKPNFVIIWRLKSRYCGDWYNLEMKGSENECFFLKTVWVVSWVVPWSDFQAFLFTCWQRGSYLLSVIPGSLYACCFHRVWDCARSQHRGCCPVFSRAGKHILWVQSPSFSSGTFLMSEQHLCV